MWPGYLEIACGAWLIASPCIFDHESGSWFMLNDIGIGATVILFVALSFFASTRWAHLATGGVALWLAGAAYLLEQRPGPPAAQNETTTALVLLTLFVLPNAASRPPEPWRRRAGANR